MRVPATANGSPDVKGKEEVVQTTEPRANAVKPATASNTWREVVQSGSEGNEIDGFALEYLIDFQRDRARVAGEAR